MRIGRNEPKSAQFYIDTVPQSHTHYHPHLIRTWKEPPASTERIRMGARARTIGSDPGDKKFNHHRVKRGRLFSPTNVVMKRLQPVAIVGPYQDTGGGWILPAKPQPLHLVHQHNNTNNIMDNNKLSPTFAQRRAEVKLNAMPASISHLSFYYSSLTLPPALVSFSVSLAIFSPIYFISTILLGFLVIRQYHRTHVIVFPLQHYEQDADGLCTQLVKSLPKKGKQDFCVDTKAFEKAGWVIPENELELRESIGKGEFGDVMLGILRGEKVAVKMLKDTSEAAQKFLAEATLMTSLTHTNLVQLLGLVFNSKKKHLYLVTEYMSKGSLVDYLRSRGRLHVTKKDQINFALNFQTNLTCGALPLADVVKHVEKGYKMEAPEGCPSEVYEMMRQAWDLQPDRRPSFHDLKGKLEQLKLLTT
ncbi:unnamed protein product [Timema podura]|uniref:Protein kinase domain-containing protein n=1 Tax=Timema podura TaxID=61482 RepID=A0ABN7NKR8_TIMPD|nr:unnamed protein product [Timema podura]